MSISSQDSDSLVEQYSVVGGVRLAKRSSCTHLCEFWLGLDMTSLNEVAVKIFLPKWTRDEAVLSQLEKHVNHMSGLYHPNLLPIMRCGVKSGLFFMVSELTRDSLELRIWRKGRLALEAASSLLIDAIEGLSFGYSSGISHGNVKPGNILIDATGSAKVSDFGIQKLLNSTAAAGSTRSASQGNVDYMAPELIRGQAADHRADIYALGIVLFQALSGDVPFKADSQRKTMGMHLSSPLPEPAVLKEMRDGEILNLIRRMTAKDPDERPSNYAEILAWLKAFRFNVLFTEIETARDHRNAIDIHEELTPRLEAGETPEAPELPLLSDQPETPVEPGEPAPGDHPVAPDQQTPTDHQPLDALTEQQSFAEIDSAPCRPEVANSELAIATPPPPADGPPHEDSPVLEALVVPTPLPSAPSATGRNGIERAAFPVALVLLLAVAAGGWWILKEGTGNPPAGEKPAVTVDEPSQKATAPPTPVTAAPVTASTLPPALTSVAPATPSATPVPAGFSIVVDDAMPNALLLEPAGGWRASSEARRSYGNSSVVALVDGRKKTATFLADIAGPGKYELLVWFVNSSADFRSTVVPVFVNTSSGWVRASVDQVNGPTDFNSLGVFDLPAGNRLPVVMISTEGLPPSPTMCVSVDALKLVRQPD